MQHILALFCKRFVRRGALALITADGKSYVCGEGPPPAIKVRFLSKTAECRVLLDPELALGEVYTNGELTVENGTIADVLSVLMKSTRDFAALVKISTLVSLSPSHVIQVE